MSSNRGPIVVVLFLVVGCQSGNEAITSAAEDLIPAPTRQIEVVENLRVGIDDPLFGRIGDIASGPDGMFYVSETSDPTAIHVFDAAGRLVEPLGQHGEGPGEYRRPSRIWHRGDSIVVFDGYYRRVLVYEPDGTPRSKSENLEAPVEGTSLNLFGMTQSGYFGWASFYLTPGMTVDDMRPTPVYTLDGALTLKDSLFAVPHTELLVVSDERSVSLRQKPYGRRSLCAVAGEVSYCGFTDALSFSRANYSGAVLDPIELEYTPVALTQAEKREARESVVEPFLSQLELSDTRPAFDAITSDDRGRLWIKVRVESGDDTTTYWVLDPESREVVSTQLDGDVRLLEVDGTTVLRRVVRARGRATCSAV